MKTKTKMAIARAMSSVVQATRRAAGKKAVDVFKRNDLHWELDLNQSIDFAIFVQGGFEPEVLRFFKKLLKSGDTVLDIGANIGAHTLNLAKLVGNNGRVVAFEPTDFAFEKLKRNLSLNPKIEACVTSVQALLVGKDDEEKPTAIPSGWSLQPSETERRHFGHAGTFNSLGGASAVRLDQWVQKNPLTRVDFIKLDVDGYEVDVLEGALGTISSHRPKIVMEFCPYVFAEQGRSFRELTGLLRSQGYEARTMGGRKVNMEAVEKRIPHGESINVILEAP